MKKVLLVVMLIALAGCAAAAVAQEKTKEEGSEKTQEHRKEITPLRIQVVFTEFEGEKKIGSLPYTFVVNADDRAAPSILRMGLRVPIATGSGGQFTYIDIGTNLDGRAEKTNDGRFVLHLGVERSSAYSPGSTEKPASVGGREVTNLQPVIQQFRTNMSLLIRDGQTIQSTVSTDPVTGHVLKVDVTLNIIK